MLPVALAASVAMFGVSMFFFDAFSFIQATFLAFTLLGLSAVTLRLPARVSASAAEPAPWTLPGRPGLRVAGAIAET
jgi:hypothetical protein